MALECRSVVNQRLYFARLHCDWLRHELARQELPKRVAEQSLGQSVVFHLVCAYRAYLSEIAEAYSQPAGAYHSAGQLVEQMARQNLDCGEALELNTMEFAENTESTAWLRDLLAHFQRVLDNPATLSSSSLSQPKQAIVVTQLESDDDLTQKRCQYFYESLLHIIESQRLRLQEW